MFTDKRSFFEAQSQCKIKGGSLALPMSAKAQQMIIEAIREKITELEEVWPSTERDHAKHVWINIEENEDNTVKTPLPYLKYGRNQPNNNDHKCIAIRHEWGDQWNDFYCGYEYPYICEFYGKFNEM